MSPLRTRPPSRPALSTRIRSPPAGGVIASPCTRRAGRRRPGEKHGERRNRDENGRRGQERAVAPVAVCVATECGSVARRPGARPRSGSRSLRHRGGRRRGGLARWARGSPLSADEGLISDVPFLWRQPGTAADRRSVAASSAKATPKCVPSPALRRQLIRPVTSRQSRDALASASSRSGPASVAPGASSGGSSGSTHRTPPSLRSTSPAERWQARAGCGRGRRPAPAFAPALGGYGPVRVRPSGRSHLGPERAQATDTMGRPAPVRRTRCPRRAVRTA